MIVKPCHAIPLLALMMLPIFGATAARLICADSKLDTRSWVEKRLRDADVVLLGQVVAEETPERRRSMPSPDQSAKTMKELLELIEKDSEPDYETNHYQSVSLDVIKQWKGPPFRIFTVKNFVVPGQIGGPLQVGNTYLVFGYKQEGSIYVVSTTCGDTLDSESAQARIEVLDEIAETAKPVLGEPY